MRTLTTIALGLAFAHCNAAVFGFAAPIIAGNQEVPPTSSQATGSGSFTVDNTTFQISGSVTLIGLPLSSITGAHIHNAAAGSNGPVVFDIMSNQIAGSPLSAGNMVVYAFQGTVNSAIFNQMVLGNTYFNFHTQQFPGGAIRGQIDCMGAIPEPATMAAFGLAIIPALRRRRRK